MIQYDSIAFEDVTFGDLASINGGDWIGVAQGFIGGLAFAGGTLVTLGSLATGQWYGAAGGASLATYGIDLVISSTTRK